MPDLAKPLKDLSAGIMEPASRHHGGAFRAVLTIQPSADVWVVHAFQEEAKGGTATPQAETEVVRERPKPIKERL